jgi:hypothetical protein
MLLAVPLFGDKDAWITPSVAVAVMALFVTIGSFWWIQVRRGRLQCYTSHVYTGCFGPKKLVFILPLVLHNPAPAPLVVVDLRLRVNVLGNRRNKDFAELPIDLRWIASHSAVYPKNETRTFAAPFAVDGRKAVEKYIEFQQDAPPTLLEDGPYQVTVEALVEPQHYWRAPRKWRELITYQFNTHLAVNGRTSLIPRSNDPDFHAPN